MITASYADFSGLFAIFFALCILSFVAGCTFENCYFEDSFGIVVASLNIIGFCLSVVCMIVFKDI